MKTIFLFFGSLLFSLFIRAQTIDTAYMECWYKFSYINLPLETMGEDLMVLQIGKNCSKFYSQYTQECDSLNATPEGRKLWRQLFLSGAATNNFPYARTHSYIHKNYPPNRITVTDFNNLTHYKFTEDFERQTWQIQPETQEILGFSCQKADCEFRGRKYEAWFTPEIPIDNGPWKFAGLPGLIVAVADTAGLYQFELTGINRSERPIYFGYYSRPKYVKTDRKTFLNACWKYHSDSGGQTKAVSSVDFSFLDSKPVKLKYDQMETDYPH